jgi:hypothetical protein
MNKSILLAEIMPASLIEMNGLTAGINDFRLAGLKELILARSCCPIESLNNGMTCD